MTFAHPERSMAPIPVAGDDAEAQNGFGNWIRVNYSCTVNATSKRIMNATLNNGKL
jgi:hypothetical protein